MYVWLHLETIKFNLINISNTSDKLSTGANIPMTLKNFFQEEKRCLWFKSWFCGTKLVWRQRRHNLHFLSMRAHWFGGYAKHCMASKMDETDSLKKTQALQLLYVRPNLYQSFYEFELVWCISWQFLPSGVIIGLIYILQLLFGKKSHNCQ